MLIQLVLAGVLADTINKLMMRRGNGKYSRKQSSKTKGKGMSVQQAMDCLGKVSINSPSQSQDVKNHKIL